MGKIVQELLQRSLEEEFNRYIKTAPYERTEERNGQRNGYYERELRTRVGALTLRICRDREGKFQTEIFERYQRSEQALVLTVAQMYFNGISTRKIDAIIEELCGFGISKSQVSELVKKLDQQLFLWRNRSLAQVAYKYLIVDARYEKIRDNGHIVSKAFIRTLARG